MGKIKFDEGTCIICNKKFPRRLKGMKDRTYSIPLRPYRSITCSTKCAVVYNRMPLNQRNLLKAQGGIYKMEQTEVMLHEDNILTTFEYEMNGKDVFGIVMLSEEKHNPNAEKGSDEEYYHDWKWSRHFKDKKNLMLFEKGLKLLDEAMVNEWDEED